MSPGGGTREIRGVECGSRWRCKFILSGPLKDESIDHSLYTGKPSVPSSPLQLFFLS